MLPATTASTRTNHPIRENEPHHSEAMVRWSAIILMTRRAARYET
jgi:hypothetical protein